MKRDREKWDERYAGREIDFPAPDNFLVEHRHLLTSGRALDLACGLGADSVFLAENGYAVDALDISLPALSRLRARAQRLELDIRPVVADLDYFPLPRDVYDLIVVFYFFSPPLMTAIADALKKRGLLFYATYNHRHTSVKPGFCKDYLVPAHGLMPYFPDLKVIVHEEEAGPDKNLARLIARKMSP